MIQPMGFWASLQAFMQGLPGTTPLYYQIPILAIVLVILYVVLGRKRVAERLGSGLVGFLHGILLAVLLVAAIFSAGNYADNFGKWRYGSIFNAYEFYHYYMGSKYTREIEYTNLYAASLVADEETGLKYSNSEKTIRNLATGGYIPVAQVLQDKQQYKDLFSKPRWEEWVKDIRFFKRELVSGRWNGVLRDKGYNATPVWGMLVGGFLSNQVSTDNRTGMLCLASLDLVLIGATLLFVAWAFGPRAALFMVLLMGTHYMMKWSHMKGAYLRTDFAMSLVISVCLLKKERYKLAGAFTAYSVLSRVFPAVFLFGIGAKLFWELCRVVLVAVDTLRVRMHQASRRRLMLAALVAAHAALAAIIVAVLGSLPLPAAVVLPVPWPLSSAILWLALFPLVTFGLILATCGLWGWWFGRVERRFVQFFVSFAVTVSILVVASLGYAGGTYLWKDYGDKIGRHNRDISPWRVGFKYIFIAQFKSQFSFKESLGKLSKHTWDSILGREPDKPPQPAAGKPAPPQTWLSGTTAILKEWAPFTRSIIYKEKAHRWWTIQAIMLLVCLLAVKGLKDHQAMAFSFVPCFFLVSPTYYYYVMLAVPLLFFTPEIERPSRALGIIWLFISAMAGHYYYSMWQQQFATYYWLSCMLFVLVLYMILLALAETASPYAARLRPAVVRILPARKQKGAAPIALENPVEQGE